MPQPDPKPKDVKPPIVKTTVWSDWEPIPKGMLGEGGRRPVLRAGEHGDFEAYDGPNGIAICKVATDARQLQRLKMDSRFAIVEEKKP